MIRHFDCICTHTLLRALENVDELETFLFFKVGLYRVASSVLVFLAVKADILSCQCWCF